MFKKKLDIAKPFVFILTLFEFLGFYSLKLLNDELKKTGKYETFRREAS